jgi:hypothetical protein
MKSVEAVRLEGAEDAPYLLVRYPPAGELLDLLKKKKIFGVIAANGKEAGAETADPADDPTAGPPERRAVKKCRDALKTGAKVRLSFQRRRRWLRTGLVTINAVGRDRVFFIDGDGLMSSLPLSALHEVQPGVRSRQ